MVIILEKELRFYIQRKITDLEKELNLVKKTNIELLNKKDKSDQSDYGSNYLLTSKSEHPK